MTQSAGRPLARLRLGLRLIAVALIVLGPIAAGARAVHAPDQADVGYVEIDPATTPGPAADAARRYLAGRNPIVDRLLPEGAGRTRFFVDLDGSAGMAFVRLGAIGLAPTADHEGWPEAVELHERAHLLQAFLPGPVSRLMARLPAARPGEYASTDRGEHFAEMAALAWQVATPPGFMSLAVPPVERLADAEARVPGTAAFVGWYLRYLRPADVDTYNDLARAAAALVEPYRAESNALWAALEARRLPDGGFRRWGYASVRECLQTWQAAARASDRWIDRAAGLLLAPSLLIVSLAP